MLSRHTLPLRLTADPSRVALRPFHLAWQSNDAEPGRAARLLDAVLALSDDEIHATLRLVLADFETRHWMTARVFLTRCAQIAALLGRDLSGLSRERRQLIGAYFCHEYSYAAAALMNPSVVPHPDQSGLQPGTCRIVLSLRAVGEGHISSIAFREGLIDEEGALDLFPEPPFATAAGAWHADGTLGEVDGPVAIERHPDSSLSGTVLFPMTAAQRNGLEDLRLTHFTHADGTREYIGTYTAYSGRDIRSELLRTTDFRSFTLAPIAGRAARNKGMALFPRTVGGGYAMIGRQDGQNLFLLRSDALDRWEDGELLLKPAYPWEFIQIGNCGPPIELDQGWLLLTHGVGAMRKYSVGAILLDKDDPSRVLARSREPILAARNQDREGYVPNVVYTCGAMKIGDSLFVPFGLADSAVGFAFAPIAEVLAALT